jgi:CarboxypepD_reg-like domain
MSKFSRFIFFFLLSCSSYAQNEIIISGSVLDINTQTPIEFATVFFSNVKDLTVIEYTSTDKNGFFKIATKKYEGSVFLKIDQTGYQTFIEEHSGLKENKDFGKIYLLTQVATNHPGLPLLMLHW